MCVLRCTIQSQRDYVLLPCQVTADVAFPNANRCNRAAVYNYRNNTWTFYDLPNVAVAHRQT